MDLIQCIKNAGIVGAGGAGFPTHVKLAADAEYLIVNSAECEPLLRVDQQLIQRYAGETVKTVKAIMDATGMKKAFFAIKAKHKKAVEALKESISDNRTEIFLLDDFYPAGDEQVMVYEVLKRVVPETGIPLKVGCVVLNVETILNINNSLSGKPVTDTYLTVAGKVPEPVTMKLPIGMVIADVLRLCGVEPSERIRVIDGGPMMGKIAEDLEKPITKTTKGLIVLDENHPLISRKTMKFDRARKLAKTACEQCRMCTDLCPRYLLGHNMQPHKMMRKVNYQYENLQDADIAFLCCECNVCELYACPVNLPPRSINAMYKAKLTENGIRYMPKETEFNPRKTREYRKIPVKRLIIKLGLQSFDKEAPLNEKDHFPEKVIIPLKQHAGASAQATVSVGQTVRKGDLIGEIPDNALGAKIHSSIDGRVAGIDGNAIVIERI